MYLQGIRLFSAIQQEIANTKTAGASAADNAMLSAVRDLTAEIRACREVFMALVSSSPPSALLLLTLFSKNNVVPTDDERIPPEVARHFTKS